jgi:hypothetical protein
MLPTSIIYIVAMTNIITYLAKSIVHSLKTPGAISDVEDYQKWGVHVRFPEAKLIGLLRGHVGDDCIDKAIVAQSGIDKWDWDIPVPEARLCYDNTVEELYFSLEWVNQNEYTFCESENVRISETNVVNLLCNLMHNNCGISTANGRFSCK